MPSVTPSTAEPPQTRLNESPITNHPSRPFRIALVAGEASGDLLGAGLVEALRQRYPDAQFAGVAGPKMRAAGVEAWFDASELAVMGLTEVLRHLPRLLLLRGRLRRRLLAWQPDVFIGIDAPDFNLGLERRLKQAGIRTVHYVSPSIWAWRAGRAAKIGQSADRVLCLFPMEPPVYAEHGVDARYVGHPLAEQFELDPDRDAARDALGLDRHRPVLAVLPGSRRGEIDRLGSIFIDAVKQLLVDMPTLQVIAPMADSHCSDRFAARGATAAMRLVPGRAHECMVAADVVLLASGTATLESMLAKRPMVVAYRLAWLSYRLIRGLGLLKTPRVSLPNALAGEMLVPELLQDDCSADNIAHAVRHWFAHPQAVAELQPRFRSLHLELRRDASNEAALAVAELIDQGAAR
jgi:lipid-A-disaccharide synthase